MMMMTMMMIKTSTHSRMAASVEFDQHASEYDVMDVHIGDCIPAADVVAVE